MEGRDIGTVVFPDAAVKVFLNASAGERARRRAREMHGTVTAADIAEMEKGIAERDARDQTRAHSPLRPADDAVVVDTTDKSIEEVVAFLRGLIATRSAALASHK
jgi:cytidylate kinase